MYRCLVGLFSRNKKHGEITDNAGIEGVKARYEASKVSLENVAVEEILSTPNFIETTYGTETKQTDFKVIRFLYRFDPVMFNDTTHRAIVVRARGKKEYEAGLTIVDGKIVKSIVFDFYG
jgi:hypothetical protein